jgi:hypothetical protein
VLEVRQRVVEVGAAKHYEDAHTDRREAVPWYRLSNGISGE